MVTLLVLGALIRSWLFRRPTDPRRGLLRRARELDGRRGRAVTARLIQDSLAEYFERTIRRPRGVLTPRDAQVAVEQVTRRSDLGERCARLVAECDRALYAEQAGDASELIALAGPLFEEIARSEVRGSDQGGG
jgi:hypothetical protein